MNAEQQLDLAGYTLRVATENGIAFGLQDGRGTLLASVWPLLLAPRVAGVAVEEGTAAMHVPPTGIGGAPQIVVRCRLSGRLNGWVENHFYCLPHRLVCRSRYALDGAHQLAAWDLCPAGSELSADALHAYVGQHPLPGDGRVFDAAEAEFSTISHNWNYCPLAPRALLKRGGTTVVFGGTSVANDFGLRMAVAGGKVRECCFDYGGDAFPHPVADAVPHDGPRLQFQVNCGLTDHQAHQAFTEAMISDGILAPKRYAPEAGAWWRPWYCTWGDQMWLAGDQFRQNVSGSKDYQAIKGVLTQDWILDTARRIRAENLNIGTFIIDDGWQDYRGDWELVTTRIPDMRALVDALHALDFKVVLWWAPFDLEKDAANLRRPELVSGPSLADTTIFDYSKPAARDWLDARMRLWFGSGSGGWNLDGLKLDFFQQKVGPGAVAGDPAWRGEEQYFTRFCRLVHGLASQYTEAPGLICAPWSPHLLPYLTTVFLEERFDTDYSNLYAKAAIRDALLPGLRMSPHFVYYPAALDGYFRMVRFLDAVPQIGVFRAPVMTPEALDQTRRALAGW
jgi:hypothetical protein